MQVKAQLNVNDFEILLEYRSVLPSAQVTRSKEITKEGLRVKKYPFPCEMFLCIDSSDPRC